MSNSLADILLNKNFDEPQEATAIKKYVFDTYQKSVAVTIRDKDIVITCQSAALANTLRMRWKQLQRAANTEKRFTFRIA